MQLNGQYDSQKNLTQQEVDPEFLPLPIRLKHPAWAVRKNAYEQILYYLKNISSVHSEIIISNTCYTTETLLPYFQNLVNQKHPLVVLKGLQCVERILELDKKAYLKHCIKLLTDKGIEYFPLLSQQRKAILQKFLDILVKSKIESSFLKNKLSLPHEKSVMYVMEVIGVLEMTSLSSCLLSLSKNHQKKCVRQMAQEIAFQLQQIQAATEPSPIIQENISKTAKLTNQQMPFKSNQNISNSFCRHTIEKLPHYEKLDSKKQQEYSSELADKIESIIDEYTSAQLPNLSHVVRLMIDDNNHIINVSAVKCLISMFAKEKQDGVTKTGLIPVSFPLLFIFNKFKLHKTHQINSLLLGLVEAIFSSSGNRVYDLFLAISEGLTSTGSKANVKFGCALSFFRIISLLYQNQDLYACAKNQNVENENQDLDLKFKSFTEVKIGKKVTKLVEKQWQRLKRRKNASQR